MPYPVVKVPITRKEALKLAAGASVALAASGLVPEPASATAVGTGSRPSVVVIIKDDMPDRLLSIMEKTRARIADQGTRFTNAYTAIPLCGPNRASILTGWFPHNTKVTTNSAWSAFSSGGHNAYTYAKVLHDGGYETALSGKYMNGRGGTSMTKIPPGYDYWFELSGSSTHDATGFDVSDNGKLVHYPANVNDSLLAAQKARDWIAGRNPAAKPFYIQFSPTNPHRPYTPTAAHAHDYDNWPPRNVPSVNEADISDKPAKIRKGTIDPAKLSDYEEGQREELEDADDQVEMILDAAEQVTGNSNLLVIFNSDNGFQTGEHRLLNKSWQYQESIEIPLLIRGTGLSAQTKDMLVSSVDIYATILQFAGLPLPRAIDGRSLHNIVQGVDPTDWRKRVLIENPNDRKWQAFREYQPALGRDYVVVRHLDDPMREFYELSVDEYQLDNKPGRVTSDMISKLNSLTTTKGANLQAVEVAV